MTKASFVSGKTRPRIADTSAPAKKLDPEIVRRAFKARSAGSSEGLDLFAVREVMTQLLHSSGGRPALDGTVAQTKIPKIAKDWEKLERLAKASSDPKHKPSTGQMAALVLHLALARISEDEIATAIGAIKDVQSSTGQMTLEEILAARHEGHKY